MVRPPCVDSKGMKKGAWSEEEDNKLRAYVSRYGHWNWRLLPKYAGLARCGKSCRLRWVNYLKPGVKKGNFTKEEEDLIIKLHAHLGNKWSAMAAQLPGRTDNEIKNFYHTRIDKHRKRNPSSKKAKQPAMEASSGEEEATSVNKPEASTLSSDNNPSLLPTAQSQQDLWSDIFKPDIDHIQAHTFTPLIEDDFMFPQLSTSDSSYMSALDWIADDGNSIVSSESAPPLFPESLWGGSYQTEDPILEEGGFYNPLIQCFDYGINWFR